MRAYYTYFKLKFITGLQYRAAAWACIATQFFFGFVYIMVFYAFYKSGSGNLPMEISKLCTYLWLNQALLSLVTQFYRDRELFNLIRSGNLCYEFARPKNLYFMWYFKLLGQRYANVVLRFLPLLLVTSFLPKPLNFTFPVSFNAFILFLIALLIGSFLVVALSVLYPIISLLTMNEKGIVNIFVVVADLLSGIVIPIPFFPSFLKNISKFLPFQYISDLSFRIYVGDIGIYNGLIGILIQIFWLILVIIIGYFLMKHNMKRVVVQGG